jgi:hypothetical protein
MLTKAGLLIGLPNDLPFNPSPAKTSREVLKIFINHMVMKACQKAGFPLPTTKKNEPLPGIAALRKMTSQQKTNLNIASMDYLVQNFLYPYPVPMHKKIHTITKGCVQESFDTIRTDILTFLATADPKYSTKLKAFVPTDVNDIWTQYRALKQQSTVHANVTVPALDSDTDIKKMKNLVSTDPKERVFGDDISNVEQRLSEKKRRRTG